MKKTISVVMILFCISFVSIYARSNNTENRFQIGIGGIVSTNNLLGLIESVKMYRSFEMGEDYDFIGMTDVDQEALKSLDPNIQRALMIANMFGAMEYGIQVRILFNAFMFETDLMLLLFDGTYNGRLDLLLTMNAGVRAPFWIMPYILGGVNFTFSFYPGKLGEAENWKSKWAATDSFVWRPGVNLRAGLDFKFRGFSVGAYYQYTIKDFEEFVGLYESISSSIQNEDAETIKAMALGMVLGSQSRFGISMCWYLF